MVAPIHRRNLLALLCALALGCGEFSVLRAAPEIYPLKDIRAGQHAIGKTVFAGTKVEDFDVEILGVLNNLGPKQSIILARLSGGPLANTGVMQGMSGSPVYIDGKLVGAVALSFPLSKEPIAGIRPIEEMLRVEPKPAPGTQQLAANLSPRRVLPVTLTTAGESRLEEIATPVAFSGFTASTLDRFAPQLRSLGLDPRQGVSGGGTPNDRLGDPRKLEPGSMISVQLVSGDLSVGADGTITAIDGDRLYAFGHRFLAAGTTDMPFAQAEVLTLLPNLQSSFKISTAREWMGSITADRDTAIAGVTGHAASLIPVEIRVGPNTYRMRMIQDRVMTPLLTQMAIFSSIDATERNIGTETYSIRGNIAFDQGTVRIDDVYSGDVAVAAIASGGVASTVGFALQSGFDVLKVKSMTLDITPVEKRGQSQILDLIAPRTAHPGDDLDLTVVLSGPDNGAEATRHVHYRLPIGVPTGTLNLTVADASATNTLEYQSAVGTPQHSPDEVISLLNALRSNTKAYLRVWRSEPSFTVDGRDLPDPPPSLAMILTRAQVGNANLVTARGAKIAEIEVSPGPGLVVTGTKTVQIEVKE